MLRSQTAFSISQYTHTPETSTVSIRLRINTKNFIKITHIINSVLVSGSQKQELVGVISLVIPNTCRTWLHLLDTLLINALAIKAIKKVQPHSQAPTLQNMNAKVVQA